MDVQWISNSCPSGIRLIPIDINCSPNGFPSDSQRISDVFKMDCQCFSNWHGISNKVLLEFQRIADESQMDFRSNSNGYLIGFQWMCNVCLIDV